MISTKTAGEDLFLLNLRRILLILSILPWILLCITHRKPHQISVPKFKLLAKMLTITYLLVDQDTQICPNTTCCFRKFEKSDVSVLKTHLDASKKTPKPRIILNWTFQNSFFKPYHVAFSECVVLICCFNSHISRNLRTTTSMIN